MQLVICLCVMKIANWTVVCQPPLSFRLFPLLIPQRSCLSYVIYHWSNVAFRCSCICLGKDVKRIVSSRCEILCGEVGSSDIAYILSEKDHLSKGHR